MQQKFQTQLEEQEYKTCTKGTTVHIHKSHLPTCVPSQVRKISWFDLKNGFGKNRVFLGRGVFGKCYLGSIGPMKACVKVYHTAFKYSKLFYKEITMLAKLCHENLPFLIGYCVENKHSIKAIIMTYHSFCDKSKSLTIYSALYEKKLEHQELTIESWQNVLFGLISALVYLTENNILHNDIKTDNIVIEHLPPNFSVCKSVLIDFGKACFVSESTLYNLSSEQKDSYKKNHPQIAPEVRDGRAKQSFSSDIYSFGRIMQKINMAKLCIPVLNGLAEQCLEASYQKRPSSLDLRTFLSNLFKR